MSEAVFEAILNSSDGDYCIQAQILAAMKPEGWR
jgi:heptaprenylglyceryl phosphate synthase